ncbi:uncharacterized protein LOC131953065 [Physella acuta]|uniref:uncharacterized protein LOC131953065 n=1 Tax=Physella acuta TaxID=109671 RepID=UPI0027DDB41F|nr:uncharacterized protein LOC131953065 [Physella acuta]
MRSLLLLLVAVFAQLFTAPLYAEEATPAPAVTDAPPTANSTTPSHENVTAVAPVNQTEKPNATNPINTTDVVTSAPPGNDTANPPSNPNNTSTDAASNSTNNPPNNLISNTTTVQPNSLTNNSTTVQPTATNNTTTVQPTATNNTGSSAAQMTTTLPVTPTTQVSPECLNGYLQWWGETRLQCEPPVNSTCFAKCSESEKKKLTDLSCYLTGVVKKDDNSSCLRQVVKCLASSPSLVNSKLSFCSAEKLPEIKSCFTKTDNSTDLQCSQAEYNQIYSSIGCNRSRVIEACIFLIFLAVLVAKVFPED